MNAKETIAWLSQLKSLRREVDTLSQRIAELELAAQGGKGHITGMPWTNRGRRGEDAAQIARLEALLDDCRRRCMEQLGQIYAFIDDMDDSRTRMIFTHRYVDGLSWQQVAWRIGETDEQVPRRWHNAWLKRACE